MKRATQCAREALDDGLVVDEENGVNLSKRRSMDSAPKRGSFSGCRRLVGRMERDCNGHNHHPGPEAEQTLAVDGRSQLAAGKGHDWHQTTAEAAQSTAAPLFTFGTQAGMPRAMRAVESKVGARGVGTA